MVYRSVLSNKKLFLPNSKDACGLWGRKTCRTRLSPIPHMATDVPSWLLRLRSDSCDICVMRQNRRHQNPQNSHCSSLYGTTTVQLDGREAGKLFGQTKKLQVTAEEAQKAAATAKKKRRLVHRRKLPIRQEST